MSTVAHVSAKIARMFAILLLAILLVGAALAVTYWSMSRRFVPGDARALDGIVRSPVAENLAFRDVAVWDGHGDEARCHQTVVIRDGMITAILDAGTQPPPDAHT